MTKAADYGFELLSPPLYFPDLAPSDYHLFPHMKKHLRSCLFKDDEETKDAVLDVLEGFSSTVFWEGIAALHTCFEECVARNSDYTEK